MIFDLSVSTHKNLTGKHGQCSVVTFVVCNVCCLVCSHVITAPSKNNAYGGTAFAGLVDTLTAIEKVSENDKEPLWRTFAHHLAAVTHFINTAAKVLSDDLW